MDSRLQLAIANDDVAELHRLIVEERNLLDHASASEDPFPNTPLHVAAAAGKTHVAMEIAILKPSFARKLNPEGYSSMHLALQHEHYQTARALMTFDPELIRVRGQGGITPLHYVAGKEGDNELELLAEFLFTCSSSIKDLTSRCETAIHVAINNHNLKAFKVLLGWLKRVDLTEILSQKDENGNTVLHIAACEGQPEIIKLLIGHTSINAKNFQGKTALEIFQENPSGDQDVANRLRRQGHRARHFAPALSLSQYFSMELTVLENYARCLGIRDESLRNIILLMSILIVTITCQVALTLPGGYEKDSSSNPPTNSTVVIANSSDIAIGKPHQVGNPILNAWDLYPRMAVNIMAFCFSTGIIWATSITLWPDSLLIYWSLGILTEVYIICLAIGFPETSKLEKRLVSAFYASLVAAALYLPVHIWLRHVRVLNRIDATRRPAGYFLQRKDRKIRKY